MFFVVTERLWKINTGATEKFAPRTGMRSGWHIIGPFTKRSAAERAAVNASGVHTCLSAVVLTAEQLPEFAKSFPGASACDVERMVERALIATK